MSLQNLLAIQQLQPHTANSDAVLKLLRAAQRNLADAQVELIGNDNRFDAAYKCIMQCAMIALWACGYRTSTSRPGHHQTVIHCLSLTMDVPKQTVIVLDGLRKQRNINDYVGEPLSDAVLKSCIAEADCLLRHTVAWLQGNHPELLQAR